MVSPTMKTPPAAAPGALSIGGYPFPGRRIGEIVTLRPSHVLPYPLAVPAVVPSHPSGVRSMRLWG